MPHVVLVFKDVVLWIFSVGFNRCRMLMAGICGTDLCDAAVSYNCCLTRYSEPAELCLNIFSMMLTLYYLIVIN